ncbi:hypothetical protein UY3_00433 [Chelonia mydas]|uniref:Uncharacterized protein n=1 Tax=Chelonia mydas TaxID=8469 RepID=M7CC38_CHEMY|nr:hypothetical protein UY3_00433 [Chelonia mydas]
MDISAGLEAAAERRSNPEDKVVDEELELDNDLEPMEGSPSGEDSQELFSTPEETSQSQQLLSS